MRAWLAGKLHDLGDRLYDSCVQDGKNQVRSPRMDRSSAALSLLDDECLGFFMLQVRAGDPPEVIVAGDVTEEYFAATGVTLHDVARIAYGVRH